MADAEAMVKKGTLYGLGVGPGDPELITVKAWRLLSLVPVIAYPTANGEPSLARRIAAPFIPEDAVELPFAVPMEKERAPAQAAYAQAAAAIAAHLDEGRDVAVLCEGDPFFYGSFMYLHQRLESDYEAVVIPGVSSLTATAAVVGRPLAARNDCLKVLPAPIGPERLAQEIEGAEAVAIIKIGRHFDMVFRVLNDLGLASRAVIVEAATREDQKITRLSEAPPGFRPYFSTILVYKGGEPW
ncbi:MAG: precorrin-2 C(20)-methyltransferase [Hyphomicrobiales bacterium]